MDANKGRCAVCGVEMTDTVVTCGTCLTPYHHDCWVFGGGCAIYGCRKTALAAVPGKATAGSSSGATDWQPGERRRARAFGACIGAGVTLVGWPIVASLASIRSYDLLYPGTLFVICALVLGAYTGGEVRGRKDMGKAVLLGLFGPALVCYLLAVVFYTVCLLPFFVIYSLPAVVGAVPCALIVMARNERSRS